ncbi:aminotransferase class I/II-fold pyridoxal phosphate-dependent enzyme [Gilvibacter sediminis]|uniref:aminotransferase class I/II-fold pyridoxal phosphate-dependent enzyme n=1 Tax=Gilvibacter sediminis TaxID=379071 RepID=UPI0023505B22|nr:8-amino-7-oxononanoate synthase [Gilvibacter sediminis]MDC7997135.1 8-amino-7-oxononanoate synthase [Gilvibacter sediminis]
MSNLPEKLKKRLLARQTNSSLRSLKNYTAAFDFSSNDYLGMGRLPFDPKPEEIYPSGSGGSRLLTGNHEAYTAFEERLCSFHQQESALVFNSGYDANLGLIAALGLRGDLILYDALAHASIRDGIQLAQARSIKFRHNDLDHLEQLLLAHKPEDGSCYVITESVFSMDGDSPDLKAMADLCDSHHAYLIVDEAHAVGVFGPRGVGLVQALELQDRLLARVVTFGKALGYHGAAVLGSEELKSYLVNFARPLIYSTALAPKELISLNERYQWLAGSDASLEEIQKLHRNIALLRSYIEKYRLSDHFIASESAIHTVVIRGNSKVKATAEQLSELGFGVLPILAPTVPEGSERIRICLHSYNQQESIKLLIEKLAEIIHKDAQ